MKDMTPEALAEMRMMAERKLKAGVGSYVIQPREVLALVDMVDSRDRALTMLFGTIGNPPTNVTLGTVREGLLLATVDVARAIIAGKEEP